MVVHNILTSINIIKEVIITIIVINLMKIIDSKLIIYFMMLICTKMIALEMMISAIDNMTLGSITYAE